jgi:hypothetical protein
MKNKIDINNLERKNPFTVPEDYFTTLTHNIMEKIEIPEQVKITAFFQLKTIVPTLAIAVILFSGFWYNKNQEINISNDDLIEILAYYEIEDNLIYDELEYEQEISEEYLLDEYNYNELIYEL